jgi:hypothetical protein
MAESQPTINGMPPRRIQAVARELHLDTDKILPHGHFIAKIPIDAGNDNYSSPAATIKSH